MSSSLSPSHLDAASCWLDILLSGRRDLGTATLCGAGGIEQLVDAMRTAMFPLKEDEAKEEVKYGNWSCDGGLPEIEGVNRDFFKKFGDPDNESSFLAKSKLITVRHGQSMENEFNE